MVLVKMGDVYLKRDQYAKAESLYEKGLVIVENILGPDDFMIARVLRKLSMLYKKSRRIPESEAIEKRINAIVGMGEGNDL